jgi:hypothetical protein
MNRKTEESRGATTIIRAEDCEVGVHDYLAAAVCIWIVSFHASLASTPTSAFLYSLPL